MPCGRASEITQAEVREQYRLEGKLPPSPAPVQEEKSADSAIPPSQPAASISKPVPTPNAIPLIALPTEELKALATKQGLNPESWDRDAVMGALLELGITSVPKGEEVPPPPAKPKLKVDKK